MAQKKQMGAAEGLKLKQAEQDIANGKTLADVIAELKRCNETACKKEVNEIKDSQKMGAAEGLKLKQAEQDIANGKTLKEVLEELRKSNAEKKAKEKIEETLDEVDKTTKQTLNEVTGKGKKESVTVEQQVETARETAKQTGLLEKIEENTRNKATALAEKDKSGFDFGKLFTGLKVIGALTALGTTIWGIVEAIGWAKDKLYNIFGPGDGNSISTNIAELSKGLAAAAGALRGVPSNAKAALERYNKTSGANRLVKESQVELDRARKVEANIKEKLATADPASPKTAALEKQLNKARANTNSVKGGLETANQIKIAVTPSTLSNIGEIGRNTIKGMNPGKFGLVLGTLGFGLGEFANGGDFKSIGRQAVAGTAGMAIGAGIGTGIGTAIATGVTGATGGLGAAAAPAIIAAFDLAGGYIGGIIASHMEKQHAAGQPLTLPPLSAFDPTKVSAQDVKDFVNAVVKRMGGKPPFADGKIRKPSANWKGATKTDPMTWANGRWGENTRAYKEGPYWFIRRVDSKGSTMLEGRSIHRDADIAELNKLEADTLAAPTAGASTTLKAEIAFGKSTTKPIDDWTDTLSAGKASAVSIAGLTTGIPTAAPIDKELTKAKNDVAAAEAKLATAQAIAAEESEEEKKVSAAVTAPEGEGVFGTIVSVLKSIGVGIESIVALMSGGAASIASSAGKASDAFNGLVSTGNSYGQKMAIGGAGNAATAMDFFKKKGWTEIQAAAIVGNLQQESFGKLDPAAVGDKGKAYGIAQWHPDRQEKFKEVMGKNIVGSSLEDQLSFVQWELTNKGSDRSSAGATLKGMNDLTVATHHVAAKYEGTRSDYDNRVNNAKALVSTNKKYDNSSSSVNDSGKSILSEAASYLGMGESSNLKEISSVTDIKDPINVPWCAAFVSGVLKKRGYKPSTAPNIAKSYLSYGKNIELNQAQEGDIAVFNRSGGGHVGFYVSHNGDFIRILGGNQSNKVTYSNRSIKAKGNELLAIRRPTDAEKIHTKGGSVIDNATNAVTDPNSRTNAGMDVGGKAGANVGESVGAEVDALLGTTGGASMGADWGAAMGKILGGGLGAPLDIMKSILKDIPIRGIPLKEGPYSPGTTIPMNINGKGKFSQSMTSAMDLIGASNRNEDIKNNKAPKPVTISNPFIDMGNNSQQAPVMASYPTRNTDPTLMKYLDMLMGV